MAKFGSQVLGQQQLNANGPLDNTTKQNAAGGFNNPQLDQIGGWVQQYTGKAPTYSDVSQWGTGGADQNYLNAIQGSIYNSQGAQDYRKNGATPPATPPASDKPPTDATGGIPAYSGPTTPPPVDINALLTQYQSKFAPGQLPTAGLKTYTPSQLLSQQGQDAQGSQLDLLQQVLKNPDVISQQDLGVLNEQGKAAALAQQQSQMQQLGDQQAALGRFGGGYQQGQARRIGDATQGNILNSYQTNQLQADQANASNRLNVLNTGNSVLDELVGRNQAQSAENLQGVNSQNQATQYNLQQALAQQSLQHQSDQTALQAALGQAGSQLGFYQQDSSNQNVLAQILGNMSIANSNAINNNNTNLLTH